MQQGLEPVLIEIIHLDQIAFLPLHNIFFKCGSLRVFGLVKKKK